MVGVGLLFLALTQLMPTSPASGGAVPDCAVIDNGTVRLGINAEGHLNCGVPEVQGGFRYGITYLPNGPTADALSPGCDCEGWGVGDAVTSTFGKAGESFGTQNVSVESFTFDDDSATSTVLVPDALDPVFRVTHTYTPTSSPNLYQVDVILENVSDAAVTPRYRRAMDWDIPPTEFNEAVTIQGSEAAADVIYSSDDGFADGSPFAGPSWINFEGDAVDNTDEVLTPGGDGPSSDHGALFDFEFDALNPGDTKEFTIFYGAAGNEDDADAALGDVGAEMYSYGQNNTPEGIADGTPNTFIFAFEGVGGLIQFPEVMFSSSSYSVLEDAGEATITVSLSGPTSGDVEVAYATSDGTATAGDDYEASSGTVTVPAGSTSATFTVSIIEDDISEDAETVNLALSSPAGATLGAPDTAVLTINNVEPIPTTTTTAPPAPPATPTPGAPTFTG